MTQISLYYHQLPIYHKTFIEIVGLNTTVLTITFANIQAWLSLSLTILSIGYLVWRWMREAKK
jgi:hypothetical protein